MDSLWRSTLLYGCVCSTVLGKPPLIGLVWSSTQHAGGGMCLFKVEKSRCPIFRVGRCICVCVFSEPGGSDCTPVSSLTPTLTDRWHSLPATHCHSVSRRSRTEKRKTATTHVNIEERRRILIWQHLCGAKQHRSPCNTYCGRKGANEFTLTDYDDVCGFLYQMTPRNNSILHSIDTKMCALKHRPLSNRPHAHTSSLSRCPQKRWMKGVLHKFLPSPSFISLLAYCRVYLACLNNGQSVTHLLTNNLLHIFPNLPLKAIHFCPTTFFITSSPLFHPPPFCLWDLTPVCKCKFY